MQTQSFARNDAEDYGEPVLSKVVKAGRRTYFIDVRATRVGDYFLTLTESRKFTKPDGSQSFEKHKMFLYKEDFAKFTDALGEVVEFIKRSQPDYFKEEPESE